MEIKKVTDKVELNDQNVKAEWDEYKCNHDCVEYYYVGSTAKRGCRRGSKISASFTGKF